MLTWSAAAGEYGELLAGGQGGKLLEGEEAVAAGEAEVVGLLEVVLQVGSCPVVGNRWDRPRQARRTLGGICGLTRVVRPPGWWAAHIPNLFPAVATCPLSLAAAQRLRRGARVLAYGAGQAGAQVWGAGAAHQGPHRLLCTGELL